jgi:hypothetical protein
MEKKKLISFIDKYHLAGNANSVKLEIKDKTLHCKFITDDQNVIGSVTMNNFDIEDCVLGVYATSQLTKLLTALDDDINFKVNNADGTAFSINVSDKTTKVTFMLADLSVIRQVPDLKNTPDWNVSFELTKDFTDKFIKSKNALPETENFAVQSSNGQAEMILNYSTLNTNRITWPISIGGTPEDLSATCFSANLFKEILQSNKGCEYGELSVSSAGLAKVVFKHAEGNSSYYLVQLQAS